MEPLNGVDLPTFWKRPENLRVLDLIKEVGAWRLGGTDGCMCMHFKVRNVDIDISCGKGRDRGLWISSPSLDYWDGVTENGNNAELLRPIAEEVARQIEESDGRGPLPIYYHEWKRD